MLIMPRKKYVKSGFRQRLVDLRKDRGLTQVQLAKAINSSQRAISHYETEAAYPPVPVIAKIAKTLKVTTDELIGVKPLKIKNNSDPATRRLWKKFQKVKDLPVKDQRAIIRMVNSLAQTSGK